MFSTKDLLSMIENEDPQIVADNFANALNEAIKEKSKRDAKKILEESKFQDMKALIELFVEYIKKYYPDLIGKDFIFTDEDIQTFVNTADDIYKETKDLLIKDFLIPTKKDPLKEFLRKNNL